MLNISFSGKSLVSKERVIRTKEEDAANKVFFISMVATNFRGVPEKWLYLFDLLTKDIDLSHSGAEVVGMSDLIKHYKLYHLKQFYLKQTNLNIRISNIAISI